MRDGEHVDHDDGVERHGSKLNNGWADTLVIRILEIVLQFGQCTSFWNLVSVLLDLVPVVVYFSTIGTHDRVIPVDWLKKVGF